MNLYIINLIWSRQCWRPASSVSGGIPAVSSSAQGNRISACIKKKYFLRIQNPSPLLFPMHYQSNCLGFICPSMALHAQEQHTPFFVFCLQDDCATFSHTRAWSQQPIHLRVFGMGYTRTVFIRPAEGDAQILQPVEDRAAHLSEHRNGH